MPTARSTARRNIRPTTCRSSIRRPTRCRSSRCRWPIRTCRYRSDRAMPARSSRLRRRPTGATRVLWDTRANNHNSMFDKQGPRLARGDRARHGQSGLVQEGLGQSVRQGVPDRKSAAPGGGARSEDQEIQLHRHLLRHPSSAVRLRRRQHAVAVAAPARWPAGSTPRCSTRPATRRRRTAGRRSCSTPTATASATSLPSRASRRTGQGQAHQPAAPAPTR